MALLDAAALGQQLQQLAGLQAAHAAAGDLAPLQAFCAEVLSQRNSGGRRIIQQCPLRFIFCANDPEF
jgi:hypothetical protein